MGYGLGRRVGECCNETAMMKLRGWECVTAKKGLRRGDDRLDCGNDIWSRGCLKCGGRVDIGN